MKIFFLNINKSYKNIHYIIFNYLNLIFRRKNKIILLINAINKFKKF
jgi:hypothetical protein